MRGNENNSLIDRDQGEGGGADYDRSANPISIWGRGDYTYQFNLCLYRQIDCLYLFLKNAMIYVPMQSSPLLLAV